MYSKPSDIPFDEPGTVKKKKKKPRMMVPDDLGEVVTATSERPPCPRAVPEEAHEQGFDLMGLLDGYPGMAAQEGRQQGPPAEPQLTGDEPLPEGEITPLVVEVQPGKEAAGPSQQASILSPSSPPKKATAGRPTASEPIQPPDQSRPGPPESLSSEVSQPPAVKVVPAIKPTAKQAKRPTPTPWTSKRVNALKYGEAQPPSPAQKCAKEVRDDSNPLQRPCKPPGFNAPLQTSRQGFPGVHPGRENAPKAVALGGGQGQAVEGLASQLEAAWPSLAPSKPTAMAAPDRLKKVPESQVLQESPGAAGNWPVAVLTSGPQELREVVRHAPRGQFGPVALKNTAVPHGRVQKGKIPVEPPAPAGFKLERPRPPKPLERLPSPVDADGESPGLVTQWEFVGHLSHKIVLNVLLYVCSKGCG
jgi:hypothetical protein